jgi:gas vesicle protein
MENNVKLIAAVLVGAVVGTVAGILIAPAKGKETRSKIRTGATDLAEELKTKIGKGVTQAKGIIDNAKEFTAS